MGTGVEAEREMSDDRPKRESMRQIKELRSLFSPQCLPLPA